MYEEESLVVLTFRLPEFEARRVHNADVATSSWPRQKSVAIKRSEDAPVRTCNRNSMIAYSSRQWTIVRSISDGNLFVRIKKGSVV